jgi:hypothetical protein
VGTPDEAVFRAKMQIFVANPFEPSLRSWRTLGRPKHKDQKDFKDGKDEQGVAFKVNGFTAIKPIP